MLILISIMLQMYFHDTLKLGTTGKADRMMSWVVTAEGEH